MPDQRKKRWLIILVLVLALLAPISITAVSYLTFSGEHQDEICMPGTSSDSSLAVNDSFESVGTVRVATWNGLFTNSHENLTRGAREIAQNADILGMQEMGRAANREAIANGMPGFSMTPGKNSTPILWRTSMFELVDPDAKTSKEVFGEERVEPGASGVYLGPRSVTWVVLRVKSTGSIITVINNHIVPTIESGGKPNDNKRRLALMDRQFDAIDSVADDYAEMGPVFVTGDFNINAKKDAEVKHPRFAYQRMRDMGFLSSWSQLGPPAKGTVEGGRVIDYVFSTNTTAAKPTGQSVLLDYGSDHKPVVVTYKGSATETEADKPNVSVASLSNSNSGTGDAPVVKINASTSTSGGTPPENYDKDYSRGVTLNKRTLWMLEETTEKLFGQKLKLPQGSYNAGGVTASAGTHDGGGAIDIEIAEYTKNERNHLVKALRQSGFAAWIRTPSEGFPLHIHAIAIGDKELSKGAADQVKAYFKGLDGLWHDGREVRDTSASIGRPVPDWALQYGSRTSNGQKPAFNDIVGKSYDSGDPTKGTLRVTPKTYDILEKILSVVYGMKEIPDQHKDKAAVIAVSTVWIESDFRNDPTPDKYGSVGLFQQIQRYYGAAKELLNPALATKYFLKGNKKIGKVGLIYVPNWQNRDPADVAQAVQKSAPNDYRKVVEAAEKLVKDMRGNVGSLGPDASAPECDTSGDNTGGGSGISGQCQSDPVTIQNEQLLSMGSVVSDARTMAQCVAGFFPQGFTFSTYNGTTVPGDVSHPTGKAVDIMVANWETKAANEEAWELARWLRAHKRELGIRIIIFDRKIWNDGRNDEGWRNYSGAHHSDHVHVETLGSKASCKMASIATCLNGSSEQSPGEWQLPVDSKFGLSSEFGMREHPVTGEFKLHDGDDYDAPAGTPIRAIADGVVKSAGPAGAYGNYVIIEHLDGQVTTGYAHMSRIIVSADERVTKGQIIGYVGSTGRVTGDHLHASARVKGYYNDLCPDGGDSKCNYHDDWVPFHDFVTNKDGIRDRLLAPPSIAA